MTNRITEKMIQSRVDYLNKITNSPMQPWTQNEKGEMKAQIGNFHMSHAYGGVCIHRMANEGGGINTPIISYHAPKRECFDALCNFISGIEYSRNNED